MRFLSLLKYQYTKYGVKELFVMLLTGFIVLTLMDALSPFLYTLTVAQMAKDSLPSKTAYFYPFDRITNILEGFDGDEEKRNALIAYMAESTANSGALGVGKTNVCRTGYGEGAAETIYVGYNQDMIQYTTLPLLSGQWSDMDGAADEIPVVVGGAYRDRQNVALGDTLQLDFALGNSETYTCRVVGILDRNDMYFNLSYGESDPTVYSIAELHQWLDNTHSDGTDYIVIYPTKPFEEMYDIEYSPGQLMFFKDNAQLDLLNAGERCGTYATLDDMIKTQIKRTVYLNKSSIVTTMALFMFCLMGLGGYSLLSTVRHGRMMAVYRICGMRRAYQTFLQIVAVFIMVAIPAGLSLMWIPRRLGNYAMLNGTFYAVYAVVLIIILLPSTLLIMTGYHSSFEIRKEI